MTTNPQVPEIKEQHDLVVLIEYSKQKKDRNLISDQIYLFLIVITQSNNNRNQTVMMNSQQSIKNSLKFLKVAKRLSNQQNKIKLNSLPNNKTHQIKFIIN